MYVAEFLITRRLFSISAATGMLTFLLIDCQADNIFFKMAEKNNMRIGLFDLYILTKR